MHQPSGPALKSFYEYPLNKRTSAITHHNSSNDVDFVVPFVAENSLPIYSQIMEDT